VGSLLFFAFFPPYAGAFLGPPVALLSSFYAFGRPPLSWLYFSSLFVSFICYFTLTSDSPPDLLSIACFLLSLSSSLFLCRDTFDSTSSFSWVIVFSGSFYLNGFAFICSWSLLSPSSSIIICDTEMCRLETSRDYWNWLVISKAFTIESFEVSRRDLSTSLTVSLLMSREGGGFSWESPAMIVALVFRPCRLPNLI
jgi:hypothetical protein